MLRHYHETRGNVLLISPGGHADNEVIATLMRATGLGVTQVTYSRHLPTPQNPENFGLDGAISWKNERAPECATWPNAVKPAIIASAGLINPHTVTDNSGQERLMFASYDAHGLAKAARIPFIELGLNPASMFGAMVRESVAAASKQFLPFINVGDYTVPRYVDKATIERRAAAALRSGTAALQHV